MKNSHVLSRLIAADSVGDGVKMKNSHVLSLHPFEVSHTTSNRFESLTGRLTPTLNRHVQIYCDAATVLDLAVVYQRLIAPGPGT